MWSRRERGGGGGNQPKQVTVTHFGPVNATQDFELKKGFKNARQRFWKEVWADVSNGRICPGNLESLPERDAGQQSSPDSAIRTLPTPNPKTNSFDRLVLRLKRVGVASLHLVALLGNDC